MNLTAQTFVNKHIHSCITYMMHRLHINADPNKFPQDAEWVSDFYLKPINPNLVSELSYLDYSLYKEDSNLRKPKGFYIVSESFARQLLLEGALVSYCFGFWIWGRETDATCLLSQDHFVQKIILKDPFL
jgi:hypothetical protein